jgi:hypothetical protein
MHHVLHEQTRRCIPLECLRKFIGAMLFMCVCVCVCFISTFIIIACFIAIRT